MIRSALSALSALTSPFRLSVNNQYKATTKLLQCAELLLKKPYGVFETDLNEYCQTTSGRNLVSRLQKRLNIQFARGQLFNPALNGIRTRYAAENESQVATLRLFVLLKQRRLSHQTAANDTSFANLPHDKETEK